MVTIEAERMQVNRNKKSIGLSFQHPEGVEILHELAKKSDVLVENYVPGTDPSSQELTKSLSNSIKVL